MACCSLLPSNLSRRQVARSQRHSLGHRNRMWCSCPQLPELACLAYLSRYLRGHYCPLSDAYQQPMVHQVRAGSPFLLLVSWSGSWSNCRRSRFLRFPAHDARCRPGWLENYVCRPRMFDCCLRHLHFVVHPRYPNAGQVAVRHREGCSSEAHQCQPNRYPEPQVPGQGDFRGSARPSDLSLDSVRCFAVCFERCCHHLLGYSDPQHSIRRASGMGSKEGRSAKHAIGYCQYLLYTNGRLRYS